MVIFFDNIHVEYRPQTTSYLIKQVIYMDNNAKSHGALQIFGQGAAKSYDQRSYQ